MVNKQPQTQSLLREQLYDEVWELSLSGVAKKYNISYGQIYKFCKEAEIPIPPSGYWMKLKFGKPAFKFLLPDSTVKEVSLPSPKSNQLIKPSQSIVVEDVVTTTFPTINNENVIMIENLTEAKSHNNTLSEPLPFLSEQERNCFYKIANSIQIPGERSKAHPLISTYKIIVSEWNKSDRKEPGAQRSPQNYSSYRKSPPFLAGVISDQSLPRVYRILGALIQGLEKLGCTVTNKLTFIIRNEEIPLEIYELQDKAEHITAKQEEAELRRYEEERKRYARASKPNIRKYDYMFNGRLCIKVGQKSFRDHKAANVENQLGELFIEMYKVSELLRKEQEAREEERRKREEAEILRLEHRKRYEMEVERTIALTNLAKDYETACRIRAYVTSLESSGNMTEETSSWIDWAKKKADWYDPSIARKDELLGIRNHEKRGAS